MLINTIFNKVYLRFLHTSRSLGYRIYEFLSNHFGYGFKKIAFRFLEKFLRVISRVKNTKIFKTYLGLSLKLTFDEAFYSGLLFYGVIDEYETKFLEKNLKKGDIVFDIGAFVDGWYTLVPASLVGSEGHVYSFEPVPKYYERLRENISLNKLDNITLVKKGVYDKEKTLSFYIADGRSSLVKEQAESYLRRSVPRVYIKTVLLDTFFAKKRIKKINLIKIDVEGVEMNVLRGAKKILTKFHPDLIIEIVEEQLKLGGSSKKEIINFLTKFGYKVYFFDSTGIKKYKNQLNLRTNNLLFSVNKQ